MYIQLFYQSLADIGINVQCPDDHAEPLVGTITATVPCMVLHYNSYTVPALFIFFH